MSRIVGEVDVTVEARLQTRVRIDEALHLVLIACDDHNQTVTIVLHTFQDGRDGFLTIVIATAILGHQRISLIDEEDTVEGFHNNRIGLGTRLSDILAYQSGTVGLHGMTFLQHTEILIDTSDDTGHGGLTSTRRSVEHQVIRHLRRLQSLCLTLLLQFHEVGQRAHFLLHGTETDQLVKFLIGIAFQRFVHNDGILLFYLFCFLSRFVCHVGILFVIRKDRHQDTQHHKADAQTATALENLSHYLLKVTHILLV